MVHLIENLAGDWRRLDERIESLSSEIEAIVSLAISPGTISAAGKVAHAPSRRTDAFSASRDFNAAIVDCARLS